MINNHQFHDNSDDSSNNVNFLNNFKDCNDFFFQKIIYQISHFYLHHKMN